uniref:C-type lectin domain-containing protein n=1 Tax=Cyprinodon variegatus TaxID=28743 RepID=A0A3Q2CMD3_CYPVA
MLFLHCSIIFTKELLKWSKGSNGNRPLIQDNLPSATSIYNLVLNTATFFMFSGQSCFINCQLYEYLYINEEKTWTEAQQHCREKHTDLATVTNMTDMKILNSTRAGYEREAWIGLSNQTAVNRTWYWSLPGVEFNERETKWKPEEPSDKGNGNENCGYLNNDLTWIMSSLQDMIGSKAEQSEYLFIQCCDCYLFIYFYSPLH